jgi:hypothetical protein
MLFNKSKPQQWAHDQWRIDIDKAKAKFSHDINDLIAEALSHHVASADITRILDTAAQRLRIERATSGPVDARL